MKDVSGSIQRPRDELPTRAGKLVETIVRFNIALLRRRDGKADDLGGLGNDAGLSIMRQDHSASDGRLIGSAAHIVLNHDSQLSDRAG